MKILLNELEKAAGQKLQLEGPIEIDGIQLPDVAFDQFIFQGQAQKEADLVRVHGEISGLIRTNCSKCITPTEFSFRTDFNEQFSELPAEEDSDIETFHGGKIELTPYFQQTIMLEMPQVYVCDETCKGLCPTCGLNWNEQTCSCSNERIDPRLADLALFFNKDEK